MDAEKKIMAMMVLAEDQQKAAQSTLDELAKQVGDIERRATAAVRHEVRETMQSVEAQTIAAFKDHGDAIKGAVNGAHGAVTAIQESIKGVSWKLALVASLAVLGTVLTFSGAAYGLVAWQGYQVRNLAAEKAALVEEVSNLRAAADDFAKRAGKAKLTTCGGRLCAEIDLQAERWGDRGEYAILKGY